MPDSGCQTRQVKDVGTQTEVPWASISDPAGLASAVRAALPAVLGALRLTVPLPGTDEPRPVPPRPARRRRPPPSAVLTSRRVLPGTPGCRVTCLAVGECDEREAGDGGRRGSGGGAASELVVEAVETNVPRRPASPPACAIVFAVGWARIGPGVEGERVGGSVSSPGKRSGGEKSGPKGGATVGHPEATKPGDGQEGGEAEPSGLSTGPALYEPKHRREKVLVAMGPKQAREMQARARQAALQEARNAEAGAEAGAGGGGENGARRNGAGTNSLDDHPSSGFIAASGNPDAADSGAARAVGRHTFSHSPAKRADDASAPSAPLPPRHRLSDTSNASSQKHASRLAPPPAAGGIAVAYLTPRGDASDREDLWAPSPPLALAFARERDSGDWLLAAGLTCGHVLVFRQGGEGGRFAAREDGGGARGNGIAGNASRGESDPTPPPAPGVPPATGTLSNTTPPNPTSRLSSTPSSSATPLPGTPLAGLTPGLAQPAVFPPPRFPFLLGPPTAPKPEPCVALEWSLDGHILATCGRGGSVRLWKIDQLHQGRPLASAADRTPGNGAGGSRLNSVTDGNATGGTHLNSVTDGNGAGNPRSNGIAEGNERGGGKVVAASVSAAQNPDGTLPKPPVPPSPQPSPGITPAPSLTPISTPQPQSLPPSALASHPALPPARLAVSPLPRAWHPFRIITPPGGWIDRAMQAQQGGAGSVVPHGGRGTSSDPSDAARLGGSSGGPNLGAHNPPAASAAPRASSSTPFGLPSSSLALLAMLSPMHSAPLPTWTRRRGKKALAFLGGEAPKVLAFDVPEGKGHAWGCSTEWEGRDWEGGFGAGARREVATSAGRAPRAPASVAPLGCAIGPTTGVAASSSGLAPVASPRVRLEPRAPGRLAAVATLPPPLDRIMVSVGPLGGAVWDAGRRAYRRSAGQGANDEDDGDDDEEDEEGEEEGEEGEDEGGQDDGEAWSWTGVGAGTCGGGFSRGGSVSGVSTPNVSQDGFAASFGTARAPASASLPSERLVLVMPPPSAAIAAEAAAASGYLHARRRLTLDQWVERMRAAGGGRSRPGLAAYAPSAPSTPLEPPPSIYLSALGAHVPRAAAPPAASSSHASSARLIARFAAGKSRGVGRSGTGVVISRYGVETGDGGGRGGPGGGSGRGDGSAGATSATSPGHGALSSILRSVHGGASSETYATYSPLSQPHVILFPPVMASRASPGVVYVALGGGSVEVWDLSASLAAPRRRWRPCRADVVAGVALPPVRRARGLGRDGEQGDAEETPEDRLLLADANGAVHLCVAGKHERRKKNAAVGNGKGGREDAVRAERNSRATRDVPASGGDDGEEEKDDNDDEDADDKEYLSRLALLDGVLLAERSRLMDEAVGEMLAEGEEEDDEDDDASDQGDHGTNRT